MRTGSIGWWVTALWMFIQVDYFSYGSTYTVTKTTDSGSGTLRTAITQANTNPGPDTIVFNISGGPGLKTIAPLTPLPFIVDRVVIDGWSQGGSGYAGPPLIEINGASSTTPCNGFEVYSASNTFRGLVINRFAYDGIVLVTNGNNVIEGNYIGTDAAGTLIRGNGHAGINIVNSPGNTIGGTNSTARNIVSGNQVGIALLNSGARQNQLLGNYIGLDVTGTLRLGNTNEGIRLNASIGTTGDYPEDNLIGANWPGARNIISGNAAGIVMEAVEPGFVTGPRRNRVVGNYIGTDRNGSTAVSNQAGILLLKASQNVIGGTNANEGNLISGNSGTGIYLENARSNSIQGNLIGTDLLGLSALSNLAGIRIADSWGNLIGGTTVETRNIIAGNSQDGIRIGGRYSTNNLVQGNFIGVDITGQSAEANGKNGILITTNSPSGGAAMFNSIGTAGAGGNIISGNGEDGVQLAFGATSNRLYGNKIGLSANALVKLPNLRHGVSVLDGTNNVIGSALSGAGNVIAANQQYGVFIADGSLNAGSVSNQVQGNVIGLGGAGNRRSGVYVRKSSGNWIGGFESKEGNKIAYNGTNLLQRGHGVVIESGTNNPIVGNAIWANAGRGISLGTNSFTVNDVGDIDAGANELQNYPVVTKVSFNPSDGYQEITWTLYSRPNRLYHIEFFRNSVFDPSGFGEGESPLGATTVLTDTNGIAVFSKIISLLDGNIAVTATDLEEMNTSEFSPVDTDGDGIADAWEVIGIDYNEDGTNDLVLAGAEVLQKDIFVEIDTMAGRTPDLLNLNRVLTGTGKNDGFINAPNTRIQNRDGQNGIRLHLEMDETNLPIQSWPSTAWGPFQSLKSNYFGKMVERNDPNAPNILAAKRLVYRYCIFADAVTNKNRNTGRGEFGGNDFFVAEGATTSDPQNDRVPGTFMHELGHTLGLKHGGVDTNEFKPNYHSVMNYQWQGPNTVNTPWILDYSREEFADLNEGALDEGTGIGASTNHAGHMVLAGPYIVGGNRVAWTNLLVPEVGPIDWNQNSVTNDSGVNRDINFVNGFSTNPSPGEVLIPCEDWSRLRYYFLGEASSMDGFEASELDNDMPRALLDEFEKLGTDVGFIQFSASSYSVGEADAVAVITVTRLFEAEGNVSVAYSTVNGTANSPADYTNVSGTLTFTGSETVKTFDVPIVNDAIAEGPETLRIQLSNATGGARLGPRSEATVTILDNDPTNRFTVINTNNSGAGSLRQAILDANTNTGIALIDFNIPGSSGLTISPASALPALTNIVILEGTAQPGYAGVPLIELNGASAGSTDGLIITGGRSTVRGLIVNRFNGSGITLQGKGQNVVEGCYLGLNRAGTLDQGNTVNGLQVLSFSNLIGGLTLAARNYIAGNNNNGIQVTGTNNLILGNVVGLGVDESDQGNTLWGIALASTGNTVGGKNPFARNVVSGNDRDGIAITANNNTVLGNYIGTALNGLAARANSSNGIAITGASNNTIGGEDPDAANVISSNRRFGVELSSATGNFIQGNRIGLGATGEVAIVNQLGGILVTGTSLGNRIGEPVPGGANMIAFNNSFGVHIQSDFASNNVVRGNQIFNVSTASSSLGIDLNGQGFNFNDEGDGDVGANGLQNCPTLTSASNSFQGTVVVGDLNSRPNTNYTIDFYANAESVWGGRMWIGMTNVTTDTSGNVSFTASTPAIYLAGPYITATATDPAGNTSEFSYPVPSSSSLPGATFTVVNTNDSGPGSLRQAILDSNNKLSALNTIEFNIPGSGVQTITPLTPLPAFMGPALVDGYSQPGSAPNTAATGHNGTLLIELNGSLMGNGAGLSFQAGNSTLRGVVVNRFIGAGGQFSNSSGVQLGGPGGNRLEGCFFGTDPSGMLRRANRIFGVIVVGESNVIGGPLPAQRNIISGTDLNVIPGIGYQEGFGLRLNYARNTRVEGNLIGVAADGMTSMSNATYGVFGVEGDPTNNVIGGVSPGTANVIAYNGIGVSVNGAVLGNSIYSNFSLGIGGGVGPYLSSAIVSNGSLTIQGRMNGLPNSAHRIEFFANDQFHPSGYGEGKYFLAWTNVTTDSNGFAVFSKSMAAAVTNGQFVSATSTDERGLTSGFSLRLRVGDVLTNVIVVNTTDNVDDGAATATHTSFREAIFAANNHIGADQIRFAIGTGPQVISAELPQVVEPTTIDATTQPGYAGKPIIYLDGLNQLGGALSLTSSNVVRGFAISRYRGAGISMGGFGSIIESNYIGTDLTGTNHGVVYQQYGISFGGTNHLISRNLISGNFAAGIQLCCGLSNRIVGNLLGTDAAGVGVLFVLPPAEYGGVFQVGNISIRSGARNTVIGGSNPADRNVIATQGFFHHDIFVSDSTTTGTIIDGNFIGTDVTGSTNLGNSDISLSFEFGANQSVIRNNVIAGYASIGIYLGSLSNLVVGNYIGTDVTGSRGLGGFGWGIVVQGGYPGNVIGGPNPASRNLISANINGVELRAGILQGNFIGTRADGVTPLGNLRDGVIINGSGIQVGGVNPGEGNLIAFNGSNGVVVAAGSSNPILGNSIFGNSGLGIDLGGDGITANDLSDLDSGVNNLQNFPIISAARNIGSATLIQGTLNSRSNTTFRIEFFSNTNCHASGSGEGRAFLNSMNLSTDAGGSAAFSFSHPVAILAGSFITATATDADSNTSEFSPCQTVINDTNYVVVGFSVNAPYSIYWPTSAVAFSLERATNLMPPIFWQTLSNNIITNAGNRVFFISNTPAATQQYFRLRKL